eukprot:g23121.t1
MRSTRQSKLLACGIRRIQRAFVADWVSIWGRPGEARQARPAVAQLTALFGADVFEGSSSIGAEADLYALKSNPGHNVGAVDEIVTKYHSWDAGSGPDGQSVYNEVGLVRFPALTLSECSNGTATVLLTVKWISSSSLVLAYGPVADQSWPELSTTWDNFPSFEPLAEPSSVYLLLFTMFHLAKCMRPPNPGTLLWVMAPVYPLVDLPGYLQMLIHPHIGKDFPDPLRDWWSSGTALSMWLQPDDTVAANNPTTSSDPFSSTSFHDGTELQPTTSALGEELPSTASETTSTAGTRDSSTSTLGEKILGVCLTISNLRADQSPSDLHLHVTVALAAALELEVKRLRNVVIELLPRRLVEETEVTAIEAALGVSYEVEASSDSVKELLSKVTSLADSQSDAAGRFTRSLKQEGLEVTHIQMLDVPHIVLWFLLGVTSSAVAGCVACSLGYFFGVFQVKLQRYRYERSRSLVSSQPSDFPVSHLDGEN